MVEAEQELVIEYLTGVVGQEILNEYNNLIKSEYNTKKAQESLGYFSEPNNLNDYPLKYKDGVVIGSNPFEAVLINQVLERRGLRIANVTDIDTLVQTNPSYLEGYYVDAALISGSYCTPRRTIEKDLAQQISERGEFDLPVVIPLTELYLELDNTPENEFGLLFKLKEDAQIISAPQLALRNTPKPKYKKPFQPFSETDENGLPIVDEQGQRRFYPKVFNLHRLFLMNLDFGSWCNFNWLPESWGNGRILAVNQHQE
jgi:hypothetical protein